jgi:hypothetical protein
MGYTRRCIPASKQEDTPGLLSTPMSRTYFLGRRMLSLDANSIPLYDRICPQYIDSLWYL